MYPFLSSELGSYEFIDAVIREPKPRYACDMLTKLVKVDQATGEVETLQEVVSLEELPAAPLSSQVCSQLSNPNM